jgi:hypothetical protein
MGSNRDCQVYYTKLPPEGRREARARWKAHARRIRNELALVEKKGAYPLIDNILEDKVKIGKEYYEASLPFLKKGRGPRTAIRMRIARKHGVSPSSVGHYTRIYRAYYLEKEKGDLDES